MRLEPESGKSHKALTLTADDHHSEPTLVSINDTSTVVGASSVFNMDVALGDPNFQGGRAILLGGKQMSGNLWRECVELTFSRDSGEAMGGTVEDVSFKKVYAGAYSKQVADSFLSHKIFDLNLSRIAISACFITGSNLRIQFQNTTGVATTLWVKGQAVLF